MPYKRINWTNTVETPLNAQNLNKMDEGIYNNQSLINNLEKLATYPNLSADCLKHNFTVSNGAILTTENGCINIIQQNSGTTILISDLLKNKAVDTNRLMLVKLRIKMLNSSSNLNVYIKYITVDDEIYVSKDNIIASNLRTNTGSNSDYLITDNEIHNVWCVFGCPTVTEITGIGVELAPFAQAEISNIQAFYSLDKVESGESYKTVTANYDVVEKTNEYEVLNKEEVEI